jgi:hypothetical protein
MAMLFPDYVRGVDFLQLDVVADAFACAAVRRGAGQGPGIYMVLGLRDLAHHLTNARDGYSRVQAKGYADVNYREVPDLGETDAPSGDE